MASSERKRADRERKRQERQALRLAGAPTPGVLDRAIVNALAEVVSIALGHSDLRPKDVVRTAVTIQDILRVARKEFADRGLSKEASDAALVAHLASLDGALGRSGAKPVSEPIPEPEDDPQAYPEADADQDPDPVLRMLDDLACSFEPEDL